MRHIKLFESWLNEDNNSVSDKLVKFAKDTIAACEATGAFKAPNKKGKVITFRPESIDEIERVGPDEYGMGRFEDNYAMCISLGDIETTGTDDYNFSIVFEMDGDTVKGVSVCSDIAENWEDHHEEIAEAITPEATAKAFATCFASACLAYKF